ncbi:DNA topoisomerase IB [Ensifer soli]|uniref:DNA topoisomerase IB n=1 Tax=Ciceribacter sp. sgz301302 TaxID=3342379 RepID=UPI0035BABD12
MALTITAKPAPAEEAEERLVYLSAIEAGISRRAGKNGFLYYDTGGKRITDRDALDRFARLAIPPAYTDVLIAEDSNAHLQAVGTDLRGRRQYRYHPDWSAARARQKFALLPAFAAALPDIRACVDRDLRLRRSGMAKALATVVALLDRLMIRVGNAVYAEENGSYGLTTLRNRHVKIDGANVHFAFKGKSGKEWRLSHSDRRIAGAIRMLHELPGHHLFQYVDEDGESRPIRSEDVNAYIRDASGGTFSSRQFRTWGATRLAAMALAAQPPAESARERARQINAAIDAVAAKLVNTRAVCRASYVHPRVIEDFETGALATIARARSSRSERLRQWMDEEEIRVLSWLKRAEG